LYFLPSYNLFKEHGIEPGKRFDPTIKQALDCVPQGAQELMKWKVATLARVANGWSMNTDTMGVYGNYYPKRAIVAQLGLGPCNVYYPVGCRERVGVVKPLPRSVMKKTSWSPRAACAEKEGQLLRRKSALCRITKTVYWTLVQ
jgi:hypothetical protein